MVIVLSLLSRGWLSGRGHRQPLPAGAGFRGTARPPAPGVPGPSLRAAPPGAGTPRAALEPHDLPGPWPRRPPPWRTPTAAHTACAPPRATAARPAPAAPRPARPVGPAHRS